MREIKDRVKRYFTFSKEETKGLIISILVLGFILGFNDGRSTSAMDAYFIANFLFSFLIVALALLLHISVQKIVALQVGFKAEFKMWIYGLAAAFIVVLISGGRLWLLIPGGILCTMSQRYRLGRFRYGLNYWPLGWIAFTGSLANLVLALIIKIFIKLPFLANNLMLHRAILFNVVLAVLMMLPIPKLDGINLYYSSRLGFMFAWGCIIGASLLIYFDVGILLTLLGTALCGTILWFIYLIGFEMRGK